MTDLKARVYLESLLASIAKLQKAGDLAHLAAELEEVDEVLVDIADAASLDAP